MSYFFYPFVSVQVGCTHILTTVNNAVTNMKMPVSRRDPDFTFFGYIPRRGITGLYSNSTFNFLRNLHYFP